MLFVSVRDILQFPVGFRKSMLLGHQTGALHFQLALPLPLVTKSSKKKIMSQN